ncbi:MAG: Asp-tRNA(Asn)/Glu-tRNA(Gln) amidotransferase subunit GatC [Bacillota bacterium]
MCIKLKVSIDDIRQASWDARINLTPEEEAGLEQQIIKTFKQLVFLQEKGLDKIEATYYPYAQENILREDVALPSLPLETVMSNAPDADAGFFHVPKIVE